MDRSIVNGWLAENGERIFGKVGEMVGTDEALTRFLLALGVSRHARVLEGLAAGGDQAAILMGEALQEYLQRTYGLDDDAARLLVHPIRGFVSGFLHVVGRDHVAHTDHVGLRDALAAFRAGRGGIQAAAAAPSKVLTDAATQEWARQVGDPARFAELMRWRQVGLRQLLEYSGTEGLHWARAAVVLDHGDYSPVWVNHQFATICEGANNRGASVEQVALELTAHMLNATNEPLEGRVTGYVRNRVVTRLGGWLGNLPEWAEQMVRRWVMPAATASWALGAILLIPSGYGIYRNTLVELACLLSGDMMGLFNSSLVTLLVILFPLTVAFELLKNPQDQGKAALRAIREALALIPGVPKPEPIEPPTDLRKVSGLEFMLLSWRWTAAAAVLGLAVMGFCFWQVFMKVEPPGWNDLVLVVLYVVHVGILYRISTRAAALAKNEPEMQKGIRLGNAIVNVLFAITCVNIVVGMKLKVSTVGVSSAPVLAVADLPGRYNHDAIGTSLGLATLVVALALLGTLWAGIGQVRSKKAPLVPAFVALALCGLLAGLGFAKSHWVKAPATAFHSSFEEGYAAAGLNPPGSAASAVVPGVQNVQVVPAAQSDAFTQLGLQSQQAVW